MNGINEFDGTVPLWVKKLSQDDIDRMKQNSPLDGSYEGYANTATNPGTPGTNKWYFASVAGTYIHFFSAPDVRIVVGTNDGVVTLSYSVATGFWKKEKAPIELIGYATTGALASTNSQVATKLAVAEKAQPLGVATLDAYGKVPLEQQQTNPRNFKGGWNASTNTPNLADGAGTVGDTYVVTIAGTQNLGSGNIEFLVKDEVALSGGLNWVRIPGDNTDVPTSSADAFL